MPDQPTSAPLIPLATLLKAIAAPTRWAILRELADGGSLMVSELAARTGCGADVISKQTASLRKAGLIISPRSRHLEIPAQFLTDKSNRQVDLGWCLLRMNSGQRAG